MKQEKQKTYSYPVNASWKQNGKAMSYRTQLYKTGVFVIYNSNPAMQDSLLPQDIVKLVKNLQKMKKAGEIVDLNFGGKIRVVDHEGFWRDIDQARYEECEKEEISKLKLEEFRCLFDEFKNNPELKNDTEFKNRVISFMDSVEPYAVYDTIIAQNNMLYRSCKGEKIEDQIQLRLDFVESLMVPYAIEKGIIVKTRNKGNKYK
jgi:hypothetical protein